VEGNARMLVTAVGINSQTGVIINKLKADNVFQAETARTDENKEAINRVESNKSKTKLRIGINLDKLLLLINLIFFI
jgi:hypothetical protein